MTKKRKVAKQEKNTFGPPVHRKPVPRRMGVPKSK